METVIVNFQLIACYLFRRAFQKGGIQVAELDYQYIGELVLRAQEGDSDAFAELYVATYQQQYRFSYRYLQDEFLAQDALQETYILALKNITTLRDPHVFVSWLNQINMRVCFDTYRREKRQNQELERYEELSLTKRQARGEGDSPEDFAVRQDQQEYIARQVMALPFSESQAILLRYFRNMKLEEIADMLQISQSSVKRYLNSGREKLAKQLK